MPDKPEIAELRDAWLNQSTEETQVDVERLAPSRTMDLFSTTRSEIISSIVAALLFAGIIAWRFAQDQDRLLQLGCAGVVVWAGATLFRFRDSIRRKKPGPAALAATGLEHYRAELLRRRDHLRSAWIWHGPLCLAVILSVATLSDRMVPRRFWDALPIVLALAGWAAFGIHRRFRHAAELQREIDEINSVSTK